MIFNHKQEFHNEIRMRSDIRIMSQGEIERIQQIYLVMAKDLFDMFDAMGLKATLGGGSVLGAVRHKGFIPWDDDMDIHLPRKDFEKLKQVFDEYFHGKYIFRAPNHDPHSGYRCGKIENPKVQVWDVNSRSHGLMIDVFIIENLPDSSSIRILRGCRSELLRIIAGLVFEYECSKNEERKNRHIRILRKTCLLAGWLFSFLHSERWYDIADRVNQYPNEDTEKVSIPSGRKHYFGEIYPREWIMESIKMPFEGIMLPVPKGYDAYRKQLYGDYHILPPEDQREHHYIYSILFKDG